LGVRFTESGVDSKRRKREGVKGIKENRDLHGRGRKRSSRKQSGRKLITASATLDRTACMLSYIPAEAAEIETPGRSRAGQSVCRLLPRLHFHRLRAWQKRSLCVRQMGETKRCFSQGK
jgi:hypothetical protein